jgi:CRP-like cAMP-binding protein
MDARALKDKATELFSRGKFARSAETYELYCKADPKDLQARLRMGDAWSKSGKKDRAIIAYQAAAEGFAKDGFLPRAIAASKLVLELDPAHKGIAQMLAELYARKSGASRPTTARTIGAKPEPLAQKAEPAPLTRDDAIEISVEEDVPRVAPAPAPAAPSPTHADAIEIAIDEDRSEHSPPESLNSGDGIEIELGTQPVTGEIEVPIDGVDLTLTAGALAAELELPPPPPVPVASEVEVGAPATPSPFELDPPPAPTPHFASRDVVELPPPPQPRPPVQPVSMQQPPPQPLTPMTPAPSPEPVRAPAALAPSSEPVRTPVTAPPLPLDDVRAPVSLDPPGPAPAPAATDTVVLTKKRPEPPFSSSPSGSTTAPPGLKPKRHEPAEPPQSSPSGARIWLPPAFTPPVARPVSATATSNAPAPRPEGTPAQTELERSLEAFTQFDVDATQPADQSPSQAQRVPNVASFTELDLEGDSLLQAVEAAAAFGAGVSNSASSVSLSAETMMEAPDDPKADPGALPKIPLFSDLPEEAFIALFERCPLRRAEPGDRIIDQGSQGTSFFIVCAGKVRVLRTDGEATRELATLEEGAFFGEMALLSDAPRSASVEAAAEDTQLLEIPAIVLTDLSSQHPTVASALKKFCRQRLLSNLMNSASLFRPFTKSERRGLVQRFRARDAVAGEVLIQEGRPSDGLYVVLTGEVAVVMGNRQVATLREGQVFGEMSLLTRSPTSATVKTTRRTSFLRLPREDFDELIMSHPQILEQVAELTDERRKQNATLQVRPDATAEMI